MNAKELLEQEVVVTQDDLKRLIELDKEYRGEHELSSQEYESIRLDKWSEESSETLIRIAGKMLWCGETKESFDLSLRFLIWLLQLDLKEAESNNHSYLVDEQISKIYHDVALLLLTDEDKNGVGFIVQPYHSNATKYGITLDNAFAKDLLFKSLEYNPNNDDILYDLGLYYYHQGEELWSLKKAYAYFMRIIPSEYDESYCLNNVDLDLYYYERIGYLFETRFKEYEYAFAIYKKAYDIDHNSWHEYNPEKLDEYALYNLAHCYLDGVGTKENKEEGLRILKEYIDVCKAKKIDLSEREDSDKIVERFIGEITK